MTANNDFAFPGGLLAFTSTDYHTLACDELLIDWKDGAAPPLRATFWLDLAKYIPEHYNYLGVCCMGGHGRTGTALACLMLAYIKHGMWEPKDPKKSIVELVRKAHCKEAIETATQTNYIRLMQKEMGL